jgi:hypothetical protein
MRGAIRIPQPLALRLVDKFTIEENGCWLWQGYKTPLGYGLITLADGTRSGRSVPVHRLMYALRHSWPPFGMSVCHLCDVPSCCNPEHLFLGTNVENTADKVKKGRQAKGERVGHAKLTEADIIAIRACRKAGQTIESLAVLFGVTTATIWFIEIGRTWRHVAGCSDAYTGKLMLLRRSCRLSSCGREYQPVRRKQKFCSHECGTAYRNRSTGGAIKSLSA